MTPIAITPQHGDRRSVANARCRPRCPRPRHPRQARAVRLALACLLARGHLLIEDVPGVGKTTLAHALAQVLGLAWQRVQFTSDLLPADIIGVSVFDRASAAVRLPARARSSRSSCWRTKSTARARKTQSALLEAMEERQVSADVTTYRLPEPFFVVATQNPHEQLGTFALPESQLDRFLMRITLGYPDAAHERELLAKATGATCCRMPPALNPDARARAADRGAARARLAALLDYAQALIASTRAAQRHQARPVAARRPGPGPRRAGLGDDRGPRHGAAGRRAGRVRRRSPRTGWTRRRGHRRRSRRVHRRARARRRRCPSSGTCPPTAHDARRALRRAQRCARAPPPGRAAGRATTACRVTIAPRRIYILPTRAGLAFAALLFVMLLAGLNYANSVALLLTFLLAGFALVAMHLCHRNLVGVALRGVATVDAFAGEHGRALADAGECRRHAAHRRSKRPSTPRERAARRRAGRAARRAPTSRCRSSGAAALPIDAHQTFDGVSRSACSAPGPSVHMRVDVLAWPVPRGRREPPPEAATGGSAPSVHRAGDEEWAGLRAFRSGDSPRQVAWRLRARPRPAGQGVPIARPRITACSISRSRPGADIEARLEQLSAWIVAAHARGERYGLTLGATRFAPDSGNRHRDALPARARAVRRRGADAMVESGGARSHLAATLAFAASLAAHRRARAGLVRGHRAGRARPGAC